MDASFFCPAVALPPRAAPWHGEEQTTTTRHNSACQRHGCRLLMMTKCTTKRHLCVIYLTTAIFSSLSVFRPSHSNHKTSTMA
jgi:hypothetical protein